LLTLSTVIGNANKCENHDRKTGVGSDGITSKVASVTGCVCPEHVVEKQNWLCCTNGVNKLVIV
jgi:hypothetical protein